MKSQTEKDPFPDLKNPRIMVMGAGAVGGFYGAKLSTRFDTTFIARGAHLKAMKENGIQIKSVDGDFPEFPKCVEDPAELSDKPDLILFTVKSFDTDEAIEKIKPAVGKKTIILTIQNGIENSEKLNDAFGAEKVIPGLCQIGAMITEPGVVEHSALGKVVTGCTDENSNEAALNRIHLWMNSAGIDVKLSKNIHYDIWSKFAWNTTFNMITGLLSVTTDYVSESESGHELIRRIYQEIQIAAEKRDGVKLKTEDVDDMISKSAGLGPFKTSTYQDRIKEKPMEYDAFTGALLRIAKKHGLNFPVTKTIHQLFDVLRKK